MAEPFSHSKGSLPPMPRGSKATMSKRRRTDGMDANTLSRWRAKSTAEAPGPPGFTKRESMCSLRAPDDGSRISARLTFWPRVGFDQSSGTLIVAHWKAPGGQARQARAGGAGSEPVGEVDAVGLSCVAEASGEVVAVEVAEAVADGDVEVACFLPEHAAARAAAATRTQRGRHRRLCMGTQCIARTLVRAVGSARRSQVAVVIITGCS